MTAPKLDQPGREQPENETLPDAVRQQKPIAEPPPERRQARRSISAVVLVSLAIVFGLLLVLAFYEPDQTDPDYSQLFQSAEVPPATIRT